MELLGIYKWVGTEYVELDEIKKTDFDRTRNIFYAVSFDKEIEPKKQVIIDIIYDEGKKSKKLITDPQKIHGGMKLGFVTDEPYNVVWLSYFEAPPYTKYSSPGEHTVKIKVAKRKFAQVLRERDFSEGVEGVYTFKIIDDRTD